MNRLRTARAALMAVVAGLSLWVPSGFVSGAPARAADAVTSDAVKARAIYHLARSQTAERSVMVGTLSARSSFEGRLWSDFLNTWSAINKSMRMNTAVPAGLPRKGHVFIVLGSGLTKSGGVSAKFERRLKLAGKAAKAYPAATILITGGAPRNGRTEAEAGYRWLRSAGVKASRLLRETRSASTIGNAKYSMALLAGNPRYTSYSLISDSSHLRRASVLFEAAEVLVQQQSGKRWGITRRANVCHLDLTAAGKGPLRASSVAIAADNVASLFSLTTQYRQLVATAPATPTLTGLTLTAPATVRYQVGQRLNTRGMVARARFDGGSHTNVVTTTARVTGFDTRTVGARRATVSYTFGGVTRTASFTYRVVKAVSTTTARASTRTPKKSSTRVKVTATVKPAVNGVTPTGSVRFYLDGKRVGSVALSRTASVTFRYPVIARTGTHRLTARYVGSKKVAASSRTVTVRVHR